MKTKATTFRLCAIASALLMAGAAHAEFSTDGYFRSGTGAGNSTKNTCYKLAGAGLGYRLGNECDTDVEISLKNTVKFGGMQITGNIMPTYYTKNTSDSNNNSNFTLSQAYVEAKGVDFAPEVNFWAGKRYYGRSDIHITDTKYTKLDGTGGGVDNINVGIGKLGISYFRRDPQTVAGSWDVTSSTANVAVDTGWGAAQRVNVEFTTDKVNPGGWLRVLGTYVHSEEHSNYQDVWINGTEVVGGERKAKNGQALTIQHYQHNLFNLGGGNTVYLQWARGSAGLDGNFSSAYNGWLNDLISSKYGATAAVDTSTKTSYRIADTFTWQVGAFGGQVLAHHQIDHLSGYKTTGQTVGGRVSYAFTNNFKLVGEAGMSRKKPDGFKTEKLNKFTIAPTISVGQGFFDRPELRLYYTHASWNQAAADDGSNGLDEATLGKSKKSANRYGVQVETWW